MNIYGKESTRNTLAESGDFLSVGYKEDLQGVHRKIDDLGAKLRDLIKFSPQVGERSWADKNVGWIALWSLIPAVLSTVLMTMFWLIPHLETDIRNDLGNDIKTKLNDMGIDNGLSKDVAAIRSRLDEIDPYIRDLVKDRWHHDANLSKQEFEDNLSRIKKTVGAAVKENVRVPAHDVESLGLNAIQVSTKNDKASELAWQVALDVVAYRTIESADLLQVGTAQQIATTPLDLSQHSHYLIGIVPGHAAPKMTVGGDVPLKESATIHPLGESDLDRDAARGKQVILMEGGATRIDNLVLKHVVLRNTEVFYDGSPVTMEDVVFVNCAFIMPKQDNTRDLASAVLLHAPTNFATL